MLSGLSLCPASIRKDNGKGAEFRISSPTGAELGGPGAYSVRQCGLEEAKASGSPCGSFSGRDLLFTKPQAQGALFIVNSTCFPSLLK